MGLWVVLVDCRYLSLAGDPDPSSIHATKQRSLGLSPVGFELKPTPLAGFWDLGHRACWLESERIVCR